ncbi:hypothetical protein CDD83_6968 [Cordyceps sp. RAO-2017]|nr:hypothetical protein CDD83_6968 [Cordyceps sp. RAO-2017]
MPAYLCHGFRWHRREIRIFVIVNDLEDAAPDWVVAPTTSSLILGQFQASFGFLPDRPPTPPTPPTTREHGALHHDDDFSPPPSRVAASDDEVLMHDWSPVKLLEEYDLEETASAARPYAYVADYAVRVDLSVDVAREMAKYQALLRQSGGGDDDDGWFGKLRDQLQAGEPIGWYVVACADEERAVPDEGPDDVDEALPPPIQNLPVLMKRQEQQQQQQQPPPQRPQTPPPSRPVVGARAHTDWPIPGSSDKPDSGSALTKADSSQPDFLADDPCKDAGHHPGLRRKLSAKGLRRFFTKKEAGR